MSRRPWRSVRRAAVSIRVTGTLVHGGLVVELSWEGRPREVVALYPGEPLGRIPFDVLKEYATDKTLTRAELEKIAGLAEPPLLR